MSIKLPEPNVAYEWEPITDLPENWRELARPDLDKSLRLWVSERESLHDRTKVEKLEERLATRWAIETGIIERLYTVDRGTTETLVALGLGAIQQFSTTGNLTPTASRLIEDQKAALDFVFQFLKEERPLSTSYIKELHQLLTQNQTSTEAVDQFGTRFQTDLIRGDWKRLANNPLTPEGGIHEYCPPEFVPDEMDRLIALHHEHEESGVRAEVEAAWLHHRFTQIHPFQDGNGRVARTLATMVFLKHDYLPLVIRDIEHRERYLDALSQADEGRLEALISLFANIEAKDLEDAITFVREMRGGDIRQLATSAAEAAQRRIQSIEEDMEAATRHLIEVAEARLREVAHELKQAFQDSGITLAADVVVNNDENENWWYSQIVSAAQEFRYYADLSRFRYWLQLRLAIPTLDAPRWHIILSLHHKQLRAGVMAGVLFLTTSDAGLEDTRPVILGTDREFTFSAGSEVSDESFRDWLEAGLTRLLEEWQSRV